MSIFSKLSWKRTRTLPHRERQRPNDIHSSPLHILNLDFRMIFRFHFVPKGELLWPTLSSFGISICVLYKEIYFVISILYSTQHYTAVQYIKAERTYSPFMNIIYLLFYWGAIWAKQKRHFAIFINGNWLLLGIRIRVCSFLDILWFLEEFSYSRELLALVSPGEDGGYKLIFDQSFYITRRFLES